jgi:biopolymer transport protein ExbD
MSHSQALSRFQQPIRAPGRRLLHHVPLKSVTRKVLGHGNRSLNHEIPLIPFIDFLLCIVCFLLASFSASGETPPDKNTKIPSAQNATELTEAPIIAITGTQILVDGVAAGNVRMIEEANRLTRVDELFDLLKGKRELWKASNPEREFPGVVTLQIDRRVPALVVKSVFQTAAMAGFPAVSFQVRRLGSGGA